MSRSRAALATEVLLRKPRVRARPRVRDTIDSASVTSRGIDGQHRREENDVHVGLVMECDHREGRIREEAFAEIYVKDPEGNTIEIYAEVPEYDWRAEGMGGIAQPFDIEAVPASA
jgi:hypothetical protein